MVAGEWPVDDVLELAGIALQTVAHVQAHRAGNLIGNVVSLTIAGVSVYTLLIKMEVHVNVITQLRGQCLPRCSGQPCSSANVEITKPLVLVRLLILTSQTHTTDLFDEDIDLVFEVR